ncbi:hypothetical protein [Streptomyces sp. CC53]|uniref:hypothetical protein n=1 Tax=Streptomyces sp. CC53 TaxID=1906740 RepID=UPI001C4309C3|nr:hypothetical protein [Streptomyces sp. CC53]
MNSRTVEAHKRVKVRKRQKASGRLRILVQNSRTGERHELQVPLASSNSWRISDYGLESILAAGARYWSHGWDIGEMQIVSVERVIEGAVPDE